MVRQLPEEVFPSLDSEACAAAVLRHERVPFVSYPYEWSFSQLKDAALLTLELQSRALDAGMRLKDASAYNIQLDAGRPILIDSLTELTAYTVQMWRMADGKEPAPKRHPAFNVAQYLVRNGRDSVRVGRRGL